MKTTTYVWEGSDHTGNRLQGEIHAYSSQICINILQQQAILPYKISIKPGKTWQFLLPYLNVLWIRAISKLGVMKCAVKSIWQNKAYPLINKKLPAIIIKLVTHVPTFCTIEPTSKLSKNSIMLFTRQLATLVNANIPLITALNILKQDSNNHLQKLISNMQNNLEIGHSFGSTLQTYPKYFNQLFCSLVTAGEKIGTLDLILTYLADYLENQATHIKKLQQAMIYPIIVLTVTTIITALLITLVIPQFANIYANCNATMPTYTLAIIHSAEFIKTKFWLLLIIIACLALSFYWAKTNPRYQHKISYQILQLPYVGAILKKTIVNRFTYVLAMTIRAGLPLTEALTVTATTCNNSFYRAGIQQICHQITTGQPLNLAMKSQHLFPQKYLQLIAIGEESGTLEMVLAQLAKDYAVEINHILSSLHTIFEPAIIIIIGIIIGAIIIGVYLPIFNLGNVI